MDELITSFLETYATEEQRDFLVKTIELLEQLDYSDIQPSLLNQINDVENIGAQAILDTLFQDLTLLLGKALKLFGIHIEPHISLSERYTLITQTIELEDYLEAQSAIEVLEGEPSSEEAFSALMELVHGESLEDYLTKIERVSPDLIERIKMIYIKRLTPCEEVDEKEIQAGKEKHALYLKYRAFLHDEIGPFGELIRQGYPSLMPFSDYLLKIKQETLDDDTFVKSVVLAALICSEDKDWYQIVHQHLEELNTNPGIALRLEKQCRELIRSFTDYLNTGVRNEEN